MKKIVANFEAQLIKALEIVKEAIFHDTHKKFENVLICGLGGSGIAGSVVKDLVHDELDCGHNFFIMVCSSDGK